MSFFYNPNEIVADLKYLTCRIYFYESKNINLLISALPLLLCEAMSVYTLIRFYRFYKRHPEEMTRRLMCEIKSASHLVPLRVYVLLQPCYCQGDLQNV